MSDDQGRRANRGACLWAPILAVAALGTGCGYVPARFSDTDPVRLVHDDYPVPVPERNALPDEIRYSEAYVEHAVVEGLDPRRTGASQDVNSWDEVPASSWFSGRPYVSYDDYRGEGPPALPLTEQPREKSLPKGVRVFLDHAGNRWEVVPDERYRTGMRPAAGLIASRLVSALGYYVAETYPVQVDGVRILAVRFPAARGTVRGQDALDLGPTTSLGTRLDDKNDVIDHQRRRSLRALGLVAAWIGLDEIRPWVLRDVYIGTPNIGFVQHQVVGLEDALGAGRIIGILRNTDADRPPSNPWLALGSFGFARKEKLDRSATPSASVGLFPERLDPSSYHFSVPFPPALEAEPADLYWIGKRIAAITHSRIEEAVSSGELDPRASTYLEDVLIARRDLVARYAMSLVTPLDVTGVIPAAPETVKKSTGRAAPHSSTRSVAVELDDLAIRRGFERAATSRYDVDFFDDKGRRLKQTESAVPRGSVVRVYVPAALLDQEKYVIMRLRAYRDGRSSPRPLEVHLRGTATKPLLRGIRH